MVIGIIGNVLKPKVQEAVPKFMTWLEEHQIPMLIASDLHTHLSVSDPGLSVPIKELGKRCGLVVAFGGDGTILSAAQAVGESGVPILGVNLGGLGFLAEVLIDELFPCFEEVLAGKYQLVERMVLRVEIIGGKHQRVFHALNDAVVEKGGFSRMVKVGVSIDDNYFNTYYCDGVITSTPTGSTAYSLSAGGPIVVPTMEAMIVTPICPHTLAARPLVIPESSVIQIKVDVREGPVNLSIDGQSDSKLYPQNTIEIRKADYSIRWVASPHKSFYDVLRQKLNS
jgi:NAD+ kinase